ncbi:hypothetical protein HOI18_01590 [Candidatus Uhrbacteria bacterium]|jgi:hypothetical protein|nr:hypothetical protein [Candidatus Uhrbacteria bacterium]
MGSASQEVFQFDPRDDRMKRLKPVFVNKFERREGIRFQVEFFAGEDGGGACSIRLHVSGDAEERHELDDCVDIKRLLTAQPVSLESFMGYDNSPHSFTRLGTDVAEAMFHVATHDPNLPQQFRVGDNLESGAEGDERECMLTFVFDKYTSRTLILPWHLARRYFDNVME